MSSSPSGSSPNRGSPRGGRAGRWVRQSPRQGLSSGIHLGSVRFVRPVRLPEELVRVEHRERRARARQTAVAAPASRGRPREAGGPRRSRAASSPPEPGNGSDPAERGGRDEQVRAPDDGESGEQRAPGNVRRGGARGGDDPERECAGTEGDRVALGPEPRGRVTPRGTRRIRPLGGGDQRVRPSRRARARRRARTSAR